MMGAQILRHQCHRGSVAAMAGDNHDLPHAGARHALADGFPARECRLRRQRLRASEIDMLGRDTDPLDGKKRRRDGVGEMLANDWSLVGNFMYDGAAPGRLAAMAASGTLSLGAVTIRRFPLAELPLAIEAAASMRALDLTVVGGS